MALAGLLADKDSSPIFSDEFPSNSGGDLSEGMAADPEPGKPAGRTRRKAAMRSPSAPRAGVPASRAAMVKDLAEEFETYGKMVALSLSVRGDEVCAAALSKQSREIAQSLAVLAARSERVLSVMHGGGLLADIVRLGHALLPVVVAVRSHHSGRKEETNGDGSDALAGFPAYAPGRPYAGDPAPA